ncbi:putative Peptidase A1 domain-containing protein [Seiridium unicorne]|uniref:Peptidase A1 domain-containing protein n=1 Tax=Seiridium unicorne TaxID=138068 RepID=A0ABR2UWE1_9PEZI
MTTRSQSNTTLEAVVISPSEYFEGNDGPWSSFDIRVGTPEQDVRVLVSTASPESMVVLSEYGCSTSVFTTVPSDCAVSRGNLFNPNDSTSWSDVGTFGINENGVGLEANLGYYQAADFALDHLGIGLLGPSLDNQTVAGIATAEPFYLGIFGLNSQPVNFTSLGNYSSPSFLTALKSQGIIPSLSWSYTAGAQYRKITGRKLCCLHSLIHAPSATGLKEVYGQLIFSGYDTSRFTENSVSFTMAGDVTRDLVVALQSISYSGSTSATLLSDAIDIYIDSTDPYLWLPDDVCDAFEDAFGLTLDNTSGLYLVNDTHHTTLLDSDAEVSFRLSDVNSGGDSVRIVLPYDAFDLTAEAPLVDNTSYYFPLKRAANATQYTLGRTFLQEAYLTADYERGVFNVSACAWVQGAEENIVTITSKDSESDCSSTSGCTSTSNGTSLGGGSIAGIVIGCVLLALLIAAVVFVLLRRRKKRAYAASEPEPDESVLTGPVHNSAPKSTTDSPVNFASEKASGAHGSELDGEDTHVRPNVEMDGTSQQIYQLHGESMQPRSETPVYYELAGSEAGRTETDQVSTVGTLPSRDEREGDESPPSPFVSTLGTTGWQDERGDADLVSPSTPVNPAARLF